LLKACFVTAMLLTATPALAEEREFCANRPGLGTPACTLTPDRSLAVGLAWQFG
jgi:hypothetical protein